VPVPCRAPQEGNTPRDVAASKEMSALLLEKPAPPPLPPGQPARSDPPQRQVRCSICGAPGVNARTHNAHGALAHLHIFGPERFGSQPVPPPPPQTVVPPDVASLLSRLSLSPYGAALCDELGVASCADLERLTEADLEKELPSMRVAERHRLLEGVKPSAKFDYFLSHFQRNGGASMLLLKSLLEARGKTCWLDKDAVPNEDGMMRGVADSAVFLLYLTRGVLTRPFCCKELRRALELRKPILLLWEKEDRGEIWKDDSGAVRNTAASMAQLRDEAPRDPLNGERGEFDAVFNTCVAVQSQLHAVAPIREAMLGMVCDAATHAFLVPWPQADAAQ
jgi:hypothetical protein